MATSPLTEDAIVDAALAIVRRDGVGALSMRALSRELGVSAMAAYYYVANKQELLDLVAAQALAKILTTDLGNETWPVRLRTLIDRIDATLRQHRGVGEVLLDRMHSTQRDVMRTIMELLSEAGFDDTDVVRAYALIHTYLFGRYRVTLQGDTRRDDVADPTDIVSRASSVSAELHGADFYDFGVETLIRGLQTRVPAPQPVLERTQA
ncbi:TetR family transcriptional regulator [Gordonia polyisoprenivorans]|uniref:TetR family transcriptional regulator n=1 Tax=Gordonia polyisoprenivorans TaxID=84595 RepID=UPI001AD689FF|nr:TetR/AcrR family transcriptional regulator C-terminal domain-containing protein [Gordonia polyisoprenivorans]QTI71010.1 TetR/AcrR family transcriptional regulator C-terminal domain-containing protein [Gordonia polyisoprenivorans]